MVDIDNEADELLARKNNCDVSQIKEDERTPTLSIEDALEISQRHNLPVTFYYPTFSSSPERPKFRLAFIMDKVVTDPGERRVIMETLISLFAQSDKACLNADRIFLGTNKKAVIHDENARISMKQVLAVYSPPPRETRLPANARASKTPDPELDALKRNFDFSGYLIKCNGEYSESGNILKFKNCAVCGHKDNLRYYKDTNCFR